MTLKTCVIAITFALTCGAPVSAQIRSGTGTATDSRGEIVITHPGALTAPLYHTVVTEWVCVDPVRIEVTRTMRESGQMEIARFTVQIANIPIDPEYGRELQALAQNRIFIISPACQGDVPIAGVNYADSVDSEARTVTLHHRLVPLRAPLPNTIPTAPSVPR